MNGLNTFQMEEINRDTNFNSEIVHTLKSEFSELKRTLDNRFQKIETLLSSQTSNVAYSGAPRRPAAEVGGATVFFKAGEKGDNGANLSPLEDEEDISKMNTNGNYALHEAARSGQERAVVALLRNADVDSLDESKNTALHWACAGGHQNVVRHLLAAGANVNVKNCDGIFPLLLATQNGHLRTVELLTDHKAALDEVDAHGNSSVVAAAKAKQWEIFKLLLQRGASADKYRGPDNAPLWFVVKEKKYNLLSALLKQMKQKEKQMKLVLTQCDDVCVPFMFEVAAPGFFKTPDGRRAISYMAANGKIKLLSAMLDTGAGVDDLDSSGASCLIYAALYGQEDVVKILLDRGASVNVGHRYNNVTALHTAAFKGNLACVRLLLEAGADVDAENIYFETPFHVATTDEVRELLKSCSSSRS